MIQEDEVRKGNDPFSGPFHGRMTGINGNSMSPPLHMPRPLWCCPLRAGRDSIQLDGSAKKGRGKVRV